MEREQRYPCDIMADEIVSKSKAYFGKHELKWVQL